MLKITIPGDEFFDDENQEFITQNSVTLELEHSLASLSKWEAIWEKPFLGPTEKTFEEAVSYIRVMTVTPDIPPEVFDRLTEDNFREINDYINSKMTATWFAETPNKSSRKEIITAEVIYYWMMVANIPDECEHWHLNRLFTLIKVVNEKNAPQKKMSRREIAARNRELNAQRQRQLGTRG